MKIPHVGNELSHELGCAVSLVMQCYKVTYLYIGEKNTTLEEKTVYTDVGIYNTSYS
ncbi:MAG: hypothetical protein QXE05_00370 [Nitrososphaeria archaeon]